MYFCINLLPSGKYYQKILKQGLVIEEMYQAHMGVNQKKAGDGE